MRGPTQDEFDALQGTSGQPSNTNRYVTDADPRVPTATGAATSVFGNSTGAPAARADIAAATNGHYLKRAAGALAWGLLTMENVVSQSTALTGLNDYNPAGFSTCDVLRLSATGGTLTLTGLSAPTTAKLLIFANVGSNTIVLADESASSLAANRFALFGNVNVNVDQAVMLWYDLTSARWRVLGGPP